MANKAPPPQWFLPMVILVAVIAFVALGVYAYISNKPAKNQPNGQACTKSSECQSGFCNDHSQCDDPPCTLAGFACSSDSNCCTGSRCTDAGVCSKPDSYIAVSGYNMSGFGSGKTEFGSEGDCEDACGDGCIGVSYFSDKTCTTVNSMPTSPLYGTDVTSYVKKRDGQKVTLPGAFIGQTGTMYSKQTQGTCEALCTPPCVGYSFDSVSQNCYLANDTSNLMGVEPTEL